MLKIKNVKNKGRGLFAKNNIKKDDLIEVSPIVIIKEQLLPQEIQDIVFQLDKNKCFIALGLGSLFNHCDNENVYYQIDIKNKLLYFYAKRDIKKNEELSINYGATWFSDRGIKKL